MHHRCLPLLYRQLKIIPQLLNLTREKVNEVTERVLRLIETAAMAGRIKARERFPGAQLPATESLWANASHWACDALNRTARSPNPAKQSPYEMCYGSPPPLVLLPFPKPDYCMVKRENISQAKAQECVYLGPTANHLRRTSADLTPYYAHHASLHLVTRVAFPICTFPDE